MIPKINLRVLFSTIIIHVLKKKNTNENKSYEYNSHKTGTDLK